MASVEYFETIKEKQNSLHENERKRQQLEEEMRSHLKSDQQQAKLKATRLKAYWKKVCENQKQSQRRNEQIMADLERITNHMATMSARTERLRMLKQQYSDYIDRTYPQWQQLAQKNINQARMEQDRSVKTDDNSKSGRARFPSPTVPQSTADEPAVTRARAPQRASTPPDSTPQHAAAPVIIVEQPHEPYKQPPIKRQVSEEEVMAQHKPHDPAPIKFPTVDDTDSNEVNDVLEVKPTEPVSLIQQQKMVPDDISDIWSDDDEPPPASDSHQEEDVKEIIKAVITTVSSKKDHPSQKVETPRSTHSKSEDSSIKADLSVTGLRESFKYLENDITGRVYSEEAVDGFYRTQPPNNDVRSTIISGANEGTLENSNELNGEAVSMVILEQLTLVIRSTQLGCVLSNELLNSNLSNINEQADLRAILPPQCIPIWDELFKHFQILLRHKVMDPKEIAAIFVPCIIAEHSMCQNQAFSLLVTLLVSEQMAITGDTDSLSLFSHRSPDQVQRKPRESVPRLLISSTSERAVTDDDSTFYEKSTSKKVPLNETPAYRALTGTLGSTGNDPAEDTDDDVEKHFASVLNPGDITPSSLSGRSASGQNDHVKVAHKPKTGPGIVAGVKISDLDTDTEMDLPMEGRKEDNDDGDDFDFYD